MTSELTGDDLDAIQQRTDAFGSRGIYGYVINDIEYQGNWVHDIHRLLDEVDRLRARLASFDFEDCVSIGSQQVRIDALEDELSRLRAENTTQGVLGEIAAERAAQDAKWGEQNHPDGTGVHFAEIVDADVAKMACQDAADGGYLDWLHILREEVAEAFAESNPVALRAELIQVAAVAVAWVEAIDRRALGLVQDGGR